MASAKPVICLVHGAWHHPLYYRSLIDPLRAQGYTVLAPISATVGIDDSIIGKTHVDDVKRIHEALLPHLDAGKEAVLVCHSYGGIPGTSALQGHTVQERKAKGLQGGAKAILYIAAIALPHRDISVFMTANGKWPDWQKTEGGFQIISPEGADILFSGIAEEEKQKHMSNLMYQSDASFHTGTNYATTEVEVPKTYVVCTEDKALPPAGQRAMAEAMGARIVEFVCGHSPFLMEAESRDLVEIILQTAAQK